jgi:acyl-CoA synthetase (NDP forming)
VNDRLKQLDLFFRPKSVAIIGASAVRGKIGHEIVRSLVEGGFRGKIYPITLRTAEILGFKCYENISSVVDEVDLAVYALSSRLAPSIIDECGRKGVKDIVIVSGGFKEVGGEFKDLEAEVVTISRQYGMRIIGPNCIGVFDGNSRFDTFFQPYERMPRPSAGPISMISQSGTYGVAFLEAANEDHIGISKMVSYGNRADVDEADLIRYLGQDEDTKVIAIYMEAVTNGRRFLEAVKEVAPNKPIVVMKVGRTTLGVRTAQSHTGWLAGSYEVAQAAFKQFGLIVAENFEELYDIAKGLALQPLPRGRRVGMVTNGMGFAVAACDTGEPKGMRVGTYTEDTRRKLVGTLPSYVVARDIVDLTGSATSQDYSISMEALLKDSQIDLLMPSFVFQDSPLDEGILTVLPQMKRFGKPILCGHTGGSYSRRLVWSFQNESIPFYTTGDRAAKVAAAMMWLSEYRASLSEKAKDNLRVGNEALEYGKHLTEIALSHGRHLLLEHEGKALLKKYDLPVAESLLAKSEDEAAKAASQLGFPVVLKIVSPDVIHKSDVGGVLVGLQDEASVREGYWTILKHVEAVLSGVDVQGVLVQRMAPQGIELVAGGVRDREFGPVVMFGLGGIFVEVFKDVVFRLAPIMNFEALEMVHEIKGFSILKGFRGRPPADENALAEILQGISNIMVDQANIKEIDLNPVFSYKRGAIVADARVILN